MADFASRPLEAVPALVVNRQLGSSKLRKRSLSMLFATVPLSQRGHSMAWMPVSTGPTTGPVGSINAHPVSIVKLIALLAYFDSCRKMRTFHVMADMKSHLLAMLASRYATLLNQGQYNAFRQGMTANAPRVRSMSHVVRHACS